MDRQEGGQERRPIPDRGSHLALDDSNDDNGDNMVVVVIFVLLLLILWWFVDGR